MLFQKYYIPLFRISFGNPADRVQRKDSLTSSHMMELQISLILLNWPNSLLDHKIIKPLNRSQFPSSMINFLFCELTACC